MMNSEQLLRSNLLSSITHEVTDSQVTRDQQEIEQLQKIIQNMRKKKNPKQTRRNTLFHNNLSGTSSRL